MQNILNLLSVINAEYSGVLSFLSSLVLLIVTVIYVFQTKRQVDATLLAVKKSSLPQLVIEYADGYLSEVFNENGRRQLCLSFKLKNYSQDPALSIFCFGEARLQHIGRQQRILADHDSDFISGLEGGAETKLNIIFETKAIIDILEDLSLASIKNRERIQRGGFEEPYSGTVIVVKVVYANCFNELRLSKTLVEVAWFDPTCKDDLKPSHNLNKYSVPPNKLRDKWSYIPVTVNPRLTPARFEDISNEELQQLITERSGQLTRVFLKELDAPC